MGSPGKGFGKGSPGGKGKGKGGGKDGGKGKGKGKGGKDGGKGKGKGKGGKGGGKGMKAGSNVVIEAHRHAGVFIARGKEDALVTLNSTPGKDVYGEKRISVDGPPEADGTAGPKIEYRVWNPFRSKLAAAVLGGVDNIWMEPGSKVGVDRRRRRRLGPLCGGWARGAGVGNAERQKGESASARTGFPG